MSDKGGPVAARDRLKFAEELSDRYAEEVYRYVLAWTGGRDSAVDLTTQVLRTAIARMDRIVAGGEPAELEVRLIALARAAVTRWQADGEAEAQAAMVASEVTAPLFDGLGRLGDSEREALILWELLNYPAKRAAHLLGCDQEVLEELRDTAAESLWRLVHQAPAGHAVSTWERLTVCAALKQAAREWLPPPGDNLLGHLRVQVVGEVLAQTEAFTPDGEPAPAAPTGPRPSGGPSAPSEGAPAAGAGTSAPGTALVLASASPPALSAAQPTGAQRPTGTAADEGQGWQRHLHRIPRVLRVPHVLHVLRIPAVLRVPRVRWLAAVGPVLRRHWALGIAALCAAGIGVVAALALGGPPSESSQCGAAVPCGVTTTVDEALGTVEALPTSPPDPPTSAPATGATAGGGRGFPLGQAYTTRVPPTTTAPSSTTGPGRSTTTRRTTTTVHKTTTTIDKATTSSSTTTTTTTPVAPP